MNKMLGKGLTHKKLLRIGPTTIQGKSYSIRTTVAISYIRSEINTVFIKDAGCTEKLEKTHFYPSLSMMAV